MAAGDGEVQAVVAYPLLTGAMAGVAVAGAGFFSEEHPARTTNPITRRQLTVMMMFFRAIPAILPATYIIGRWSLHRS